MRIFALSLGLAALLAAGAAQAEPKTYELPSSSPEFRPGPGVEAAQDHCMSCHSADYVNVQPKKDRAFWQATVTKMIKTFHAPIEEADAKAVVDYLDKTY